MEIQESYCVVPKSEDQLETELKQHNDTLIEIFYYASELSELHSEKNIRRLADKTRNVK